MAALAIIDEMEAILVEKKMAVDSPQNYAFVFIKPHAVTKDVQALVEKELKNAKITILSQGSISAEDIDAKRLIDQHYYAIASKAVLLQPCDLPVPADKFEGKFGRSWESALKEGLCYNAMDAGKKLGLNSDELEKKWRACKKNCIKFGGGFYCSNLGTEEAPMYAFNGFFMSMREKFVAKGKSIHYFSVCWDPKELSWADFRGKLLGPTNPADAPKDSLRGQVFANWKELGLAAEPDTGDNGVHASASPFEALAERMNWLGAEISSDPYGAALVGAGISKFAIKKWSVDPQVQTGEGKGSLFDALEDTQAGDCLQKCVELNRLNLPNSAFVFIKPHAVMDSVKSLVKTGLEKAGFQINSEGSISAEDIDAKRLIDQHYYAIASKAVLLQPKELPVPADKFEGKFGRSWESALKEGLVFNAMDAGKKLGLNANQLEKKWGACKKNCVKFGGGFYCSNLGSDEAPMYVFNGFFMSMREKFVAKGKSIYCYSVTWDSNKLTWEDFRGKLLGPTNPADAPKDSLRGKVFANWKSLGLPAQPDTGDNGVHASASPFEGLAERMNWLGADLATDGFGSALLSSGVSAETIKAWSVDPQVKGGSVFDALEDTQASDCLAKAIELNA